MPRITNIPETVKPVTVGDFYLREILEELRRLNDTLAPPELESEEVRVKEPRAVKR